MYDYIMAIMTDIKTEQILGLRLTVHGLSCLFACIIFLLTYNFFFIPLFGKALNGHKLSVHEGLFNA